MHVPFQGIFTCRLYQTECTRSALATDNRSFILFTAYFNLTANFSNQQSEVTKAVVFNHQTSTPHSVTRPAHHTQSPDQHTTLSNQTSTRHSVTRPAHHTQSPDQHTTVTRPAHHSHQTSTPHSVTRPAHHIQLPDQHTTFSHQTSTPHSVTRPAHHTQSPDQHTTFSHQTSTPHLPPLSATANVELLSVTNLTSSSDFLPPRSKDDTNKGLFTFNMPSPCHVVPLRV